MLDFLDEKGFAFLFFILLLLPALPIPTAGLSHLFEAIACLVAVQLMAGRSELWLPDSLKKKTLSRSLAKKIIPHTVARIAQIETYTSRKGSHVLNTKIFRMMFGFSVALFCIVAFFAPPLSMLDTLPSLGVVIMSLGVILEDIRVVGAGLLIGLIGVGLVALLSGSIIYFVAQLFGLL